MNKKAPHTEYIEYKGLESHFPSFCLLLLDLC